MIDKQPLLSSRNSAATPRTDLEHFHTIPRVTNQGCVSVDFARQLERELDRANAYHAECVVAMVPFIPAFGYLRDAIKELGKRAATVSEQQDIPFGWWDHFNGVLVRDENVALACERGGNKITPLYERSEIPKEKT